LISQGKGWGGFHAYIGLLCLFPSGFSPKDGRTLFPTGIGLAHLFPLLAWGGCSLSQALFACGLQSWLLAAIIRRFRLGGDWLVFPALILCAAVDPREAFPFSPFVFATLCGAAAYACAVRHAPEQKAEPSGAEEPSLKKKAAFAEFEASLTLLRKKKKLLSPALHKDTDALIRAAGGILDSLYADQEERPAQARFLARYLPAAHTILDEHIRLSENADRAPVQESLENGAVMLERLAAAFQQEHDRLLRNGAMLFNAEMHTLDKLLKMDGR
jgi:hypothetical protein